jgi:integrase
MTAAAEMRLIDPEGRRLYLTGDERRAFLEAARNAPREVRTFCTVLHDTGCRISEALELIPAWIDLNAQAITIRSLKKRRQGIYRAVPVYIADTGSRPASGTRRDTAGSAPPSRNGSETRPTFAESRVGRWSSTPSAITTCRGGWLSQPDRH